MAEVLPSGVRDRATVEAARAAAAAWLPRTKQKDFVEGAIAAYEWLLGRTPAPITEAAAATVEAIRAEEQAADDAIYRRRGAVEVRQGWAVGVQHALMWARGKADPPVDFDA